MSTTIKLLAIETSCDDTSISIVDNGNIIYNKVSSQGIHFQYGGVVPELASRAHVENITILVNESLNVSNIHRDELSGIGITYGPGLLGSLLVGVSFAKAYAYCLGIPLLAVDHIKAHIMANMIGDNKPEFPFLCLVASGGHTQLVKVHSYDKLTTLGRTLDDAVGEVFDKVSKMLKLGYPGGPIIQKYALNGDQHKYVFPHCNVPGLNYSFSGVKTAIKNSIDTNLDVDIHDMCASVQYHLIDMLMKRYRKAIIDNPDCKCITIAGGVASNTLLRESIKELANEFAISYHYPEPKYCTDNAAMVGILAYHKYISHDFADMHIRVDPNLSF